MKDLGIEQDFCYKETSDEDLDRDLREKRLFPDLLQEQQEHIQDKQDQNHLRDGQDYLRGIDSKLDGAGKIGILIIGLKCTRTRTRTRSRSRSRSRSVSTLLWELQPPQVS